MSTYRGVNTNVKAVVAAFNQEKALVGAFSVIVQLHRLIVNNTDQVNQGQPPGTAGSLWTGVSTNAECDQVSFLIRGILHEVHVSRSECHRAHRNMYCLQLSPQRILFERRLKVL